MGKPTGFLEFSRQVPAKAAVQERVQHYKEFVQPWTPEQEKQQAARCMNCGIPFCHSGCPLGNVIPEFNDAVYRQQWKEAYEILSSTNNFPEFTGRICPAPCESACVLGINQPPVAIEEIEKHIIEHAFTNGYVQPKVPNIRSGKKVAVIGSGPAGLAAAAQLNAAGHNVTVYERDEAIGGLLRYGIPDFKLEKWVVSRRVELMQAEGIQFKTRHHVGVNVSVDDLLREFHAIVLAGGSTVPRDLPVEGRQLSGVHFAMPFLKQQNKRVAGKDPLAAAGIESNILSEGVEATGKHVVVIGGGDTGSDCVGTSIRQGALSVTQLELLPKPPESRTTGMPWPTYPMILKTTTSHEEGCERQWAMATKSFNADENGQLQSITIVDLQWKASEDGRPARFEEIPNSARILPCQLVLLAMGFVHPERKGLLEQLGVELDEQGKVNTNLNGYQTNLQKVFSCGDMRRGQSLVVWAISEGRECARQVDEFLVGQSNLAQKDRSLLAVY